NRSLRRRWPSPKCIPDFQGTCVQDCAFRFLRHPSRPKLPRPVAKRGSAAGKGVATSGARPQKLVSAPETFVTKVPAPLLRFSVQIADGSAAPEKSVPASRTVGPNRPELDVPTAPVTRLRV